MPAAPVRESVRSLVKLHRCASIEALSHEAESASVPLETAMFPTGGTAATVNVPLPVFVNVLPADASTLAPLAVAIVTS